MLSSLRRDIQVVFDRDPACRSVLEALTYPGLHALWYHRVAHWLYGRGLLLLARHISQIGRARTGIEIHPGARIGPGLFIDHGMGVVIGETAEVGEDVTLYQGVTLGGTGKDRGKRHPTIGNGVVIGTGAKVLGAITVGDRCKIGAGAVVVHPVPADCTVVGIPGRVVWRDGRKVTAADLEHGDLPDPVAESFGAMQRQVARLEEQLAELRHLLAEATESVNIRDSCERG
ncbi:MAG TPA: serine O-acetyltransferase [Bacillota bacterium]|nr:serine O-acetyltransferase [Bacillota bacterium]